MKRVINGKTYSKTIGVKKGELAAFGDNGELNGSGVKASDIPSFPEGGNVGDVLTKTSDGQIWSTPESPFPAGGEVGDVLTKTANGQEWSTPQGGGKVKLICLQSSQRTYKGVKYSVEISAITPESVSTPADAITWFNKAYDQQYRIPCAYRIHSDASANNNFILCEVSVLPQVSGLNVILEGYEIDFTNGAITRLSDNNLETSWFISKQHVIE